MPVENGRLIRTNQLYVTSGHTISHTDNILVEIRRDPGELQTSWRYNVREFDFTAGEMALLDEVVFEGEEGVRDAARFSTWGHYKEKLCFLKLRRDHMRVNPRFCARSDVPGGPCYITDTVEELAECLRVWYQRLGQQAHR